MGRSVQAFLAFVPPRVTHNDLEAYTFKRGGKVRAGIRKSDRLRDAEDMIRPHVQRMAERVSRPMSGKIAERVKVCWPTGGRHEQGEPMGDAPDLDNWVKTFNDICESCGIIEDDRLVVDLHVTKAWADPAGVFVRFEELGD